MCLPLALAALLLGGAVHAAAEPLTLDPPAPKTRLPELELRPPALNSAAAESWSALSAAYAAGRLDDARTLAETAVTMTRERDGPRSRSALDARLNRATVLLNGGDLGIAGEQFTRVIDDASAAEGLRAPQLEDAWYGLGLTTLAAGNPADAERAFAAALQAHRVERGLHAPGQLGYLDAMALTAAQRGRLDLADGYQLRRIELIERLHDERSTERADAAKVLADWYERTERPREALQAHMYRVDVLDRARGDEDPQFVVALLDAARAYALVVDRYRERPFSVQLRNGSVVQTTEPPLATALRILKKPDLRLTAPERGQLLLRIGEVNWILGDRRRALTAWKAAAEADPATAERLGRPEAIEWPADWPTPAGLGAGGRIELRFRIDDRGRLKDLRQAVLTPTGDVNGTTLANALRKGLNQVRFRPALRGGEYVDGVEMRYQHPFQPAS